MPVPVSGRKSTKKILSSNFFVSFLYLQPIITSFVRLTCSIVAGAFAPDTWCAVTATTIAGSISRKTPLRCQTFVFSRWSLSI